MVLVYIGAVPVNSETSINSRKIVKSSVQSLRDQNAKARTVLLRCTSKHLLVINTKNLVLNRFEPSSVVFVQTCPGNAQFFGMQIAHNESFVDDNLDGEENGLNATTSAIYDFERKNFWCT